MVNSTQGAEMPRKAAARFSFTSEAGDFVGQGLTRSYESSDSQIVGRDVGFATAVKANAVQLTVEQGKENWTVAFAAPKGRRLRAGEYSNATRFPFNDDGVPGLSMSGCGRCSNRSFGRFTVERIGFNRAGELTLFQGHFVQHSEMEMAPALSGEIYYAKARPKKG
jgi:hypothetical protein